MQSRLFETADSSNQKLFSPLDLFSVRFLPPIFGTKLLEGSKNRHSTV